MYMCKSESFGDYIKCLTEYYYFVSIDDEVRLSQILYVKNII